MKLQKHQNQIRLQDCVQAVVDLLTPDGSEISPPFTRAEVVGFVIQISRLRESITHRESEGHFVPDDDPERIRLDYFQNLFKSHREFVD